MNRYDWIKLKNQFISGDLVTVADFFRAKKIKNNSRNRTKAKSWKDERLVYLSKINTRTQIKFIEVDSDIKLRHHLVAKRLQLKGLEGLSQLTINSVDEARKMIVSGLQEERIALGLEDNKSNQNMTQVNVNLPRTRFDDLMESKSYEELLEFIAEVKKEKEHRLSNHLA